MSKKVLKEIKSIKTNNYNTIEVIFLISFTALVFMFVGAFIFYKQYSKGIVYKDKSYLKDIDNIYNSIVNDHITKIDKKLLLDSAIKGMQSFINDKYSMYISKDDVKSNSSLLSGSYIGLGISVMKTNNFLEVMEVFEDTPAFNKIFVGDVIYKIDDLSIEKCSFEEVKKLLNYSKKGEVKKVYILRNNKTIELDLKLDEIKVKSVKSYTVYKDNKQVGIIKIDHFYKNTAFQFKKELEKLNVDYLVIDLRDNTGGYISNASNIASLFLNKGDIIYRVKSSNKEELIKNTLEKKYNKKLVLLVNRNTASSAELLVSALKENLNVKVIGENTYGKGYIQKVLELESGGLFKFSSREFLTPKGNIIENKGIVVDIYIKEKDSSKQLSAAVMEVVK